jgi:hypothetical protein
VLTRGRIAESLRWVTQLMNAAETYRDPDLQIVGHFSAVLAHFHLGDPIKTREHADRVLALYSKEQHGHLASILNIDPKTLNLVWLANSTWVLGYPEQALRILDAGHAHARQVGHPSTFSRANIRLASPNSRLCRSKGRHNNQNLALRLRPSHDKTQHFRHFSVTKIAKTVQVGYCKRSLTR